MNNYLEKILRSMIGVSSTLYHKLGENFVDQFTPFYKAIIILAIIYILATSFLSQAFDGLKNVAILILSLSFVYAAMLNFTEVKYYIFDTIIALPGDMSNYLINVEILGKKISSGGSITRLIWYTIKNDIFGNIFAILSFWNFFEYIFLIIIALFAAFCLFIIYINYWMAYFVFVIEITILSIIGIPIILISPFKTFRPMLIAWLKAIITSVLPPVFLSLIMLIMKVFITENSKDLTKSATINTEALQNSLEVVAITALIGVVLASSIGKFISIFSGLQDSSFSIFKPVSAGVGAVQRTQSMINAGKTVAKAGRKIGEKPAKKIISGIGKMGASIGNDIATSILEAPKKNTAQGKPNPYNFQPSNKQIFSGSYF